MATDRKNIKSTANSAEVDSFLQKINQTPLANAQEDNRGRLIFAMDATASRQHSWDQAIKLQHEMFTKTQSIGNLDVQLVFYRGMLECRNSAWVNNADTLCKLMSKVRCLAGQTQLARVLKHALAENKVKPVQALVFVGDCMEENIDLLGNLAGQLKLLGLPLFIFQEGNDAVASQAFSQLAKLSGGAHCRFDQSSATQLGQLLNAVAVYAAGGRRALRQLSNESRSAAAMLQQLD